MHLPGNVKSNGDHRRHLRAGEPSSYVYDEVLPDSYWSPRARSVARRGRARSSRVLPELRAAVGATAFVVAARAHGEHGGVESVVRVDRHRLPRPAASGGASHVARRRVGRAQLAELDAAGVHLAMIAPAPVDGRPLSHPDHERIWAAFVEHGVTPVFHVADQPRMFDDCWYPADGDSFVPAIESAFIWVPPALALTDLILNGVFDRHPGLRLGIVELSSIWVPQFLLMLDGSVDFTSRLNGTDVTLAKRPSDYLLDHVRIASFSYEDPARLTRKTGDVFMCCSDYPHSEGTDSPLDDYRRAGCDPAEQHGLFGDNIELLLNR